MKPRKGRRAQAESINSKGLGKVINNFHSNVLKPGIKNNVEFWKGVGKGMMTPMRPGRRRK